MAHLGNIGAVIKSRIWARPVSGMFSPVSTKKLPDMHTRYVPFYYGSGNITSDPCNGLIAGITQQDGNPAPFKPVVLFHRPTMLRVRSTISDANGAFSFPCVAKASTYFVVTLDNATGQPEFNAAIADYITPDPMP